MTREQGSFRLSLVVGVVVAAAFVLKTGCWHPSLILVAFCAGWAPTALITSAR